MGGNGAHIGGGVTYGYNTVINGQTAGVAGIAYGGGAGGACSNSATGFAGAVGGGGAIRITEYF
jgi:hypothetical protein